MYFKFTLIILFICFALVVNADTTNQSTMAIKGIDFRYGFGNHKMSLQNEQFILKNLTLDNNNILPFNQGKIKIENQRLHDLYIGLSIASKAHLLKDFFTKRELRIGLNYTFKNANLNNVCTWDSALHNNYIYDGTFNYKYRYSKQQINASYLFNSKVFNSYFAFYTGIGACFSINTWRVLKTDQFANYIYSKTDPNTRVSQSYSSSLPLLDFTNNSVSFYVPVGFKYNFSCDLNLFIEDNIGVHYHTKFEKSQRSLFYNYLCIGFRYKILTDGNTSNTDKLKVYW